MRHGCDGARAMCGWILRQLRLEQWQHVLWGVQRGVLLPRGERIGHWCGHMPARVLLSDRFRRANRL